ncbi:IS30 family transposase [Cryptosporangium phraense]|uniref:IS30 family transposase n=2 Tax=Cryptosporangium phraense TaxID=2593070 RepID=A0A545ADR7_9ACTN|nr:IS30 family transposase [Cryptosporangium phraense]
MPAPFPADESVVGARRLTLREREEIACRNAAGEGVRAIARAIDRSPSTVSRELRRGTVRRKSGYRATVAQTLADQRSRRPKTRRLACEDRLREHVQNRLHAKDSPEQISRRLVLLFPDDTSMRVSHETIYRSLYVQGRGGLRRELVKCLRTGRALRKPRRTADRRGRLAGMVNIAHRPPEVLDRAVPGHWEGDLITGAENKSAIGTLVERSTGYVMLLHLPDSHRADDVQAAMLEVMSRLPQTLRRTLTWDQGQEMANHAAIAVAAQLEIFFCDPHSPWQRAINENTNGLLRQYFPKGTDLSGYHRDYLEFVAAQLNNRPRKRLGWRTPAESLDRLLSDQEPRPVLR